MGRAEQCSAEQMRAARKQLLSRRLNEQVHRLNTGVFNDYVDDYVCECGHEGCIDPIGLTGDQYEQIDSRACRFIVRPGHWCSDERVVYDDPRFQVIEKIGAAAMMMEGLAAVGGDERMAFTLERPVPAGQAH